MNRRFQTYLLQNAHTPLATLAGAGLLIMASSRLAFALITGAALVWVYGLMVIAVFFARPIYPKIGTKGVLIFLSSFIGSLFMCLLWLINPLLAMGTAYIIILIPSYCVGSTLFSQLNSLGIEHILARSALEAGSLGLLIIAFALIREPLGFMTLSLPGGDQGIVEIFQTAEEHSFLPIKVIASSAGALLLLGYGIALFYHIRKQGVSEEQ